MKKLALRTNTGRGGLVDTKIGNIRSFVRANPDNVVSGGAVDRGPRDFAE